MNENDERNEIIKAAEQGDAISQYNLGAMYDYGEGVEQNYWMAEKWYTSAAKQLSRVMLMLNIIWGLCLLKAKVSQRILRPQ